MAAEPLTRDRVLDAAEDTLRRFGPAKTTVVDVARALGVSHGTVYRHFASKAQLRDAVLERWLRRMTEPLDAVAREGGPAADRLRRWLLTLITMKRGRAREDPDLFAAYAQLSQEARGVTVAHVAEMRRQIAGILADGMARGEFADADVRSMAAAVLAATTTFHHPAHAAEWRESDTAGVAARADDGSSNGVEVSAGEAVSVGTSGGIASAGTASACAESSALTVSDTASAGPDPSDSDSFDPGPFDPASSGAASFDTASSDTAPFDTASFDTASFDTVWRLLLLGLTPR
jgi:AcrR family transcriptional regulator